LVQAGGGGGGGGGGGEYCTGPTCPAGTTTLPGPPSAGQSKIPLLTMATDKPSYTECGSITMSGKIATIREGEPVLVRVYNPLQTLFRIGQVIPSSDGSYAFSFIGDCSGVTGIYDGVVTYDKITVHTKFSMVSKTSPPPLVTPQKDGKVQNVTTVKNQPPWYVPVLEYLRNNLLQNKSMLYYLIGPVIALMLIPIIIAARKRGRAEPVLLEAKVPQKAYAGETIEILVRASNQGRTAREQILFVEFPTLESAKNLEISSSDLPTRIVERGEKVGSDYAGMARPIHAKYPMVELVGSPWRSTGTYEMKIRARPQGKEKFIVFIKIIAFPYSKAVHYPRKGTKDHQNEFVKAYSVLVVEPVYERAQVKSTDEVKPMEEAKTVEQKTRQVVPVAAPLSKPSWLGRLKTDYDLLLDQIMETKEELNATRKEIEEIKALFMK
jgi:hypothetical protein